MCMRTTTKRNQGLPLLLPQQLILWMQHQTRNQELHIPQNPNKSRKIFISLSLSLIVTHIYVFREKQEEMDKDRLLLCGRDICVRVSGQEKAHERNGLYLRDDWIEISD